MRLAIDTMQGFLDGVDFDVVVGAESRGFIFGTPIAYNLNKSFVPIRKKGKLPGDTYECSYALEYGTATVEVHKSDVKKGQKFLVVDDLIATGGTLAAAKNLIEQGGGEVTDFFGVIGLPAAGRSSRRLPVHGCSAPRCARCPHSACHIFASPCRSGGYAGRGRPPRGWPPPCRKRNPLRPAGPRR